MPHGNMPLETPGNQRDRRGCARPSPLIQQRVERGAREVREIACTGHDDVVVNTAKTRKQRSEWTLTWERVATPANSHFLKRAGVTTHDQHFIDDRQRTNHTRHQAIAPDVEGRLVNAQATAPPPDEHESGRFGSK